MKPELFVFLGRSGCGKGTQAALLSKYLSEKDSSRGVFYVSTGEEFRKLISGDTYTAVETKEIVDKGGFAPSFIASMLWANVIVRDYKKNDHMIVDGSPRTLAEKGIFDTIHYFYEEKKVYDIDKVNVIFLNVTKEWAIDKLLLRAKKENRPDDYSEAIEKRMYWFNNHISKVVEAYRIDEKVLFCEINGEQSIENVFNDIKKV